MRFDLGFGRRWLAGFIVAACGGGVSLDPFSEPGAPDGAAGAGEGGAAGIGGAAGEGGAVGEGGAAGVGGAAPNGGSSADGGALGSAE